MARGTINRAQPTSPAATTSIRKAAWRTNTAGPTPMPALLGSVVGPAIALAGIVASAPLVLDGGVGLSDAEVTSAF